MDQSVQLPEKKARQFLPEDFKVQDWDTLKPYFEALLNRDIKSTEDLRQWFRDRSELEAVISEDAGWRYIKMTCDTTDEKLRESFNHFVTEIEPQIAPYAHELNKKALESPFIKELENEEGYDILIRELKKDVEIFREENIPLSTQIQQESQKFGQISGAMTVEIDGKELTLQQAAVILQYTDRAKREEAYRKITERRLQDKDQLDELYNKLINLRHQIAENAGFANFRDYMFKAMGRFDYTPEDCFQIHESVSREVAPLLNEFARERKEKLGLDQLRPWDKAVDKEGKPPLKPFNNSEELVDKTIDCFRQLDDYLGDCLAVMKEMGHLDLESRKGKAPGGYNYPLSEIGVPFIFMNATSSLRDMVTIMHEGGHAVHSFLTRELELTHFKHAPSEIAELASMAMELISMDHWDLFFEDPEELKRAKKQHLEQVIETLPWVATIDKFQHWIYENPNHSNQERTTQWLQIFEQFSDDVTDWNGLEKAKENLWQKQLHLFEVPFYYIEYGMAQLGAIALWKKYKENPEAGLNGYKNALQLGYMRTIPEVYEAAGIKFDFSADYINSLIKFVKQELEQI